jgi:kynurenine formamidase
MIDLSAYRIVDLSVEMVPGEQKIDGRFLHGEAPHGRPIKLHEFIAYGARMHFIESETHNGTHVESPNKYSEAATDLGAMPVETYLGEAIVGDFSGKTAGAPITVADLRAVGIKQGDILLLRGSSNPGEKQPPFLTFEAIDWLIETKIKLMGVEGVGLHPLGTPLGPDGGDARLLRGGVAFLDNIHGLDQITRSRVFFIGLPVRIRHVTAFWTRAIVLEEKAVS